MSASKQLLKKVSFDEQKFSHSDTDFIIGVSTLEQALVFLGVDEKTPDDFIITMYTAKVLFLTHLLNFMNLGQTSRLLCYCTCQGKAINRANMETR